MDETIAFRPHWMLWLDVLDGYVGGPQDGVGAHPRGVLDHRCAKRLELVIGFPFALPRGKLRGLIGRRAANLGFAGFASFRSLRYILRGLRGIPVVQFPAPPLSI